jgi:hypothetical protein
MVEIIIAGVVGYFAVYLIARAILAWILRL